MGKSSTFYVGYPPVVPILNAHILLVRRATERVRSKDYCWHLCFSFLLKLYVDFRNLFCVLEQVTNASRAVPWRRGNRSETPARSSLKITKVMMELRKKGFSCLFSKRKYMPCIGLASFEPSVRTVNTACTQCAVHTPR